MTGATGALGSHLAKGLAEAGAEVVLVSRTRETLDALAREITAAGGKAHAIPADLGSTADVERVCAEAWALKGKVDVLLHNATPSQERGRGIAEISEAEWRQQWDVIYGSAFTFLRNLGPRMVAAGGGSVITVTSSTGMIPQKGHLAYGMAKGALMLLTKYAAQEFGPAVRANCIMPGTIDTTGTMAQHPIAQGILPRISLGRFGRNEECVGATIFLASPASSYISGQVYFIDGGRF
ncbi:MAG: SDR family oxidoreductase [Caulobacteraceae bacterium]|nr:SDR family oxidoreductase [Caulobacteraceae bacterium]